MQAQEPAVSYQNVSKRFRYSADSSKSVLESLISIFQYLGRRPKSEMWAVRDLSLDIMPGECVGIIGRNGSGKSTLLKLTTRILRPTSGQIMTQGRISALLELGTGFHPDMTGRENVYLNASFLGLDRNDVNRVFDDIVEFSELGEFIDVPVKNYSSGMYMRLGFSVAIHMWPNILIVDEILAVGDAAFQKKCFDRIFQLKTQGTTIIVVSHQLDMMRELCDTMIWMEKGAVRQIGPTEEVVERYLADTYTRSIDTVESVAFERWGSGELQITDVRLLDGNGDASQVFQPGDPCTIEIDYATKGAVDFPEFGLAIHRVKDGLHLVGPNNRQAGIDLEVIEGSGTVRYTIAYLPFQPDNYTLTVACHNGKLQTAYDYHNRAYPFQVVPKSAHEIHGVLELDADWEIDRTSESVVD